MEDAMTNYLPAIDIMMCHLGISFEQTCEQLGLSPQEQQTLDQLQKTEADPVQLMPWTDGPKRPASQSSKKRRPKAPFFGDDQGRATRRRCSQTTAPNSRKPGSHISSRASARWAP